MRSAQKHRKLIKSALFMCLIRERNNASLKIFSTRLPLLVQILSCVHFKYCSFCRCCFNFLSLCEHLSFIIGCFFGYWCCCFLCFVLLLVSTLLLPLTIFVVISIVFACPKNYWHSWLWCVRRRCQIRYLNRWLVCATKYWQSTFITYI